MLIHYESRRFRLNLHQHVLKKVRKTLWEQLLMSLGSSLDAAPPLYGTSWTIGSVVVQ